MNYELKPLKTGGLLNTAIAIFSDNFFPIFVISAIMNIISMFPGNNEMYQFFEFLKTRDLTIFEQSSDNLGLDSLLTLVLALVQTLQGVFIVHLVYTRYEGKNKGLKGAVNGALPFLPGAIIALILVNLLTFSGFFVGFFIGQPIAIILFSILGIIISIGLSFTMHIVVIEELRAVESLKRSWALTRGHRMSLFGYSFLFGLLFLIARVVPCGIGYSLMEYFHLPIAVGVGFVDFVVMSFIQPLLVIIMLLLYFNVRIAKEGFSLEQLTDQFSFFKDHNNEKPFSEE